eukprot:CAMPEP_0174963254 /NCGR_PEP_ID=MMETSP0004_2-20121128/5229_1 /TAXON_ID=420556 /ORGANISM="Ochromonas sp., Strain CCMP1393" /LENGTH=443 /DNA_ID=CAMNT_0016211861 /DNA_START=293 /DNA_END=1624 /DNA_ORIENTATION=-
MFKAGDEWLALPEVFSNLDFTADNTPASEEDIEGQIHLRSTRFWGRLYIDGWPQTIQFFRAHFGIEPPLGRKRFVFAEPRDGCTELTNADLITEEHIVLVHRGECTFGSKAKNVHDTTKASGIIIINNEPGLDHLPGPDAHDIQFSVSSVTQSEGQLLEQIYDAGPAEDGFAGRKLEGYIVPINCENSGARCLPATVQERRAVAKLIEGGTLNVVDSSGKSLLKDGDAPMEYLLAHFGVKVTHNNVSLPIAVAKPVEACGQLENDVKGKIVLVRRGTCPFVKKAEEVQAAGGMAMVVGSVHPYILRMGVEPRWKGLNTHIPVLMVSKRAYSVLVAESYVGGAIKFQEDAFDESSGHSAADSSEKRVNSETWEPLEKLAKGEGWPRSSLYITKKYEELKESMRGYPDRLATLEDAFKIKLEQDKEAEKASMGTGSINPENKDEL